MHNYIKRCLVLSMALTSVVNLEPCRGTYQKPQVFHNGRRRMIEESNGKKGYFLDDDEVEDLKLEPESEDIWVPLSGDDIKQSSAREREYYEKFYQERKQAEAIAKAKKEAIVTAKKEADKRLWHNNAWHVYEWKWTDASFLKARGRADVPVVGGKVRSYLLDDKFLIFPTAAELAVSDAKKRLWHKGAWHTAVWKDNAMNSYVDGDALVTLTDAEVVESDAQRAEDANAEQK